MISGLISAELQRLTAQRSEDGRSADDEQRSAAELKKALRCSC